jgi:hypothetical protein
MADSDCGPNAALDSGRVDASDSVELVVGTSEFTRAFTGVLEVEHPHLVHSGLQERYLGPPLARRMAVKVFLGGLDYLQRVGGGAIDPDRGAPLTMIINDCIGAPARGIYAELVDLPEVEVLHARDGILGEGPTSAGYAFVTDVPESQRDAVRVRAVRADDHETVAERQALVRVGWTTHMVLWPLTR